MENKNPLSPHLQIYKWQISSLLSITHRIVGVINFFAIILICIWAAFIIFGQNNYQAIFNIFNSTFGKFLIISFFHHPKIDESKSTAPPPPPPPLSSSSSTFLMVRSIQLSASLMTTGAFSSMNIPKLRSWCSLISASLAPHERTISSTHAGAFTVRRQNHSLIPT